MKKIFYALVIALSVSVLSSCAGSNKNKMAILQTVVEATKGHTPMTVADGIVMTDVYLDSDYFTYVYDCDDEKFDVDQIEANMERSKADIKASLAIQHDTMAVLLELLKESGIGIAYKYVGTPSGKTNFIYLESNELPIF